MTFSASRELKDFQTHAWRFTTVGATVIFQDEDYKGGWDGRLNGTPVSDGSYFYILYRSDGERYHGALTIMRQRR